MAQTQTEILHMRVAPDLIRTLDLLRKREDDLPSRTEMVRRIVERYGALASMAKAVRLAHQLRVDGYEVESASQLEALVHSLDQK